VLDSGDLARLVTQLLADDRPGAFNAIGPAEPSTIEDLIHACATAAGTRVDVVPVAPDAVRPPLPLLLAYPGPQGRYQRSAAAARAVGLTGTPLVRTAADTLAWDRARGEPPLERELSPEREAELLAAA
jgi:2'-hydroxyisoflavone reductase